MERSRRYVACALLLGSLLPALLLASACVGEDSGAQTAAGVDASADGSSTSSDATREDSATDSSAVPDADSAPSCTMCGGACVDTTNDPKNCGACGAQCTSDAGLSFGCVASKCGNQVTSVTSGYDNSCAVLLDGSLFCWGSRATGQTGAIDASPGPTPSKIAIEDVVEARAGKGFVCARKNDGTIWCWGDNTFGVLGHAPGADPGCTGTCTTTPVKIDLPGGAKAAKLAVGFGTVCARTQGATGGDVVCWGNAFGGITGDATLAVGTIRPQPQKIPVFVGDVTDISLGSYDTGGPGDRPIACALRNDKTVWCWGVNFNGALGHGGGTLGDVTCTANAPMPCNGTPIKVESLSGVTALSTGGTFACAVTQIGALYCWGNNSNGYLATGNASPSASPLQVAGLNTSASVIAGDLGVLSIDTTSSVKGWGANGHGQLALGAYSGAACASFSCFTSAQNITSLQGVTQISLNVLSGIALKGDGTVLTWGGNGSGELGHAPFTNGDTTCGAGSGACNPTPTALANAPWR